MDVGFSVNFVIMSRIPHFHNFVAGKWDDPVLVLFNDLPAHFSGAELALMQAKYIGLFQAGWFVESMWRQTLVIHMIRTPKLPLVRR